MKNPVRTNVRWRTNDVRWRTNDVRWREHGASSLEKAMEIWGLIPQDNTAIHPRSGERGILAFSREAATGGIRAIKMVNL